MRTEKIVWLTLVATVGICSASAQTQTNAETREFVGLTTNNAHVFESIRISRTVTNQLPPNLLTNRAGRLRPPSTYVYSYTNAAFREFVPGSLNEAIWTNFVVLTNASRNLQIWSERKHPLGWPHLKPVVTWNTNCLFWGLKGVTAISPCWQKEGSDGQVPLTALTRRHAYTRGHSMGPPGINTNFAGNKAWFVTRDNQVVELTVKLNVVRVGAGSNGVHQDYTLVLFDHDLPAGIEPIRVVDYTEAQVYYPNASLGPTPHPIFQTEQGGGLNTGVAPLVLNAWKPGDSGSPNLIPLPGELVFFGGRSTSGPTPQMQADMDELSRMSGLDPKKYQMEWVDLTKYPRFK